MQWVIDLSKARLGTEQDVLTSLFTEHVPGPLDYFKVILNGDQPEPELDSRLVEYDRIDPAIENDERLAAGRVLILLQTLQQDAKVTVASFRSSVKSVVEALRAVRSNIDYLPLSPYSPKAPGAYEDMAWDDSFMSRQEAIELLALALGCQSLPVRMSDLRIVLVDIDARFHKLGEPFARTNRFISKIIKLGEDHSVVTRIATPGRQSSNPMIKLTEAGKTLAERRARESRNTRVRAARSASRGASPAGASATVVEDISKSDIFITKLRTASFGPFQEVRLAVYDAIEEIVGCEPPLQLSALIREAVSRTRDRQAELIRGDRPFPWSKLRTFLVNLANKVPVFLDGSDPVRLSWSNSEASVTGLVADWRLKLDGELIVFLLRSGLNVSLDDIEDLAGALYNSRGDEYFDLVIKVVQRLVADGRVMEDKARPGALTEVPTSPRFNQAPDQVQIE